MRDLGIRRWAGNKRERKEKRREREMKAEKIDKQ
jgi:hypothetical protein